MKSERNVSVDIFLKSPSTGLSESQGDKTITMPLPASVERRVRSTPEDVGSGYWPTALALVAVDIGTIVVFTVLLGLIASFTEAEIIGTVYTVGFSVAVLIPLVYGISGLYQIIGLHPSEELRQMSTTTLVAGLTATIIAWVQAPSLALVIVSATLLASVFVPTCRVLGRILLARSDWWGVPVVVLGEGSHGKSVITTLNRWPELGFQPVALLQDVHPDQLDGRAASFGDVPCLAKPERAPNLASAFSVPYAIIAMPDLSYEERSRIVTHFGKFFHRLFVVPEGLGKAAHWTAQFSSQGLLGFGFKHFRLSPFTRAVKRGVDLFGACLGLLVLTPLLATIASLIKLDSKGPVVFKQTRMGEEGRCFTVYKFRTMHTDAEAKLQDVLDSDPNLRAQYEQYHKLKDDPRVTRMGKWLRRFSLDELPQLWNVVRGDMSLVGPRAYMPSELSKMNGLSRAVLQCRPGLTGLWQVSGRNNLDFGTRVDLDVHYMQNWTIWLDLYILIRTIPVVLSGDGAN